MSSNLLDEIIVNACNEMSFKVEQQIKVCLQPRPEYLPEFLWKAILKRLLVLQYFK